MRYRKSLKNLPTAIPCTRSLYIINSTRGNNMNFTIRFLIPFVFFTFLAGCQSDVLENRTKIGLTVGSPQAVFLKFGYDFNSEYIQALESEGAEVVKISVYDSAEEVEEKLASIRGLLIPGGVDIEPSRYGEKPHRLLERTDPDLDALEFKVLAWAGKNDMPVLGICRGHQMINVFHGGTLYQDITEQYICSEMVTHRKQESFLFITRSRPLFHDIKIEKTSLMRKIFKSDRVRVNSYHHQGVNRLAEGFRVTARSYDGFVEAIRFKGKRFIYGVQFHPEKMIEKEPRFRNIFKKFIQEVKGPRKEQTHH